MRRECHTLNDKIIGPLNSIMPQLRLGELELGNDHIILQVLTHTASQLNNIDVYRHENGFVKLTLGIYSDIQVRVHIWDREPSRDTGGSIHSHRHPISSRVVTGGLRERRWLTSPLGDIYRRYAFSPSLPGQMELAESGFIGLRPEPSRNRQSGDVYSIPLNVFHSVHPLTLPTVTVFTQDLRVRSEGTVASERMLTNVARPSLMYKRERTALQKILSDQIQSMWTQQEDHISCTKGLNS